MPARIKTVEKMTEKPVVQPVVASVDKKERKPYPSREERINMADKSIDRLNRLNAKREALIAKTQKTLDQRKAVLEKSTAALEKAVARKTRLENKQAVRVKGEKSARAAKNAEKAKLRQLQALLNQNGKTIDDLLSELKP